MINDDMKLHLPRIIILSTGGTIVSRGSSTLNLTDYGKLSGNSPENLSKLLDSLPEALSFADIEVHDIHEGGSSKLTLNDLLGIARIVQKVCNKTDIDGIVITHGTDTLEETAYFLNLVIHTNKPVVLVGAMRPSTAISADGPINLLNAIALASSPKAAGLGVLVCMNDAILTAFSVSKRNTTQVQAFSSVYCDQIGIMENFKPLIFSCSTRLHTYRSEFDITDISKLPEVVVIYSTLGSDGRLIDMASTMNIKGIVVAGFGNGNVTRGELDSLSRAVRKGISVVISTRTGSGVVVQTKWMEDNGFIAAGAHIPQKARLLLMLGLTKYSSREDLELIFASY